MAAPDAPEKNPGQAPGVDPQGLKDLWDFNFTQHELTEEGKRKLSAMRSTVKSMKDAIIDLTPPGRDQALALTKLEEMSFHANAGIARRFNTVVEPTPEEDKAKPDDQEKAK